MVSKKLISSTKYDSENAQGCGTRAGDVVSCRTFFPFNGFPNILILPVGIRKMPNGCHLLGQDPTGLPSHKAIVMNQEIRFSETIKTHSWGVIREQKHLGAMRTSAVQITHWSLILAGGQIKITGKESYLEINRLD